MMKYILGVLLLLLTSSAYASGQQTLVTPDGKVLGTASNPLVVSGVGGGLLNFSTDSSTSGNIIYVGCSDDIQTAQDSASAGDTLVLGACTYSISSTITINKGIKIIGQGIYATKIDCGSTSECTPISGTVDGITISNLQITGTDIARAILFDARATNVFTNISIEKVYINVYGDTTTDGIEFEDAGGNVSDSIIYVSSSGISGTNQIRGIVCDGWSTAESNISLRVYDSIITSINTGSGAGAGNSGVIRGIRFYNQTDTDPNNMYLWVYNSTLLTQEPNVTSSATGTNALHIQGARVYSYVYNSTLNGTGYDGNMDAGFYSYPYLIDNKYDLRCDDASECFIYNTVLANSKHQADTGGGGNGTTYVRGRLNGTGVYIQKFWQQAAQSGGVAAERVIDITGGVGANASGTGSQTGGEGSDVYITSGDGGLSTAATVTGTAGSGGDFVITAGSGGSQVTATSTTNVSGAGGDLSLFGGTGGSSTNAATTNTGGDGGSLFLAGGDAGTGATSNGRLGTVAIGQTAASTGKGYVQISSASLTIAADDTTPDVRYSSWFVTSANTGATAITDLDNPTVGQTVCIRGGSATNSSTIADSGNFKLTAAFTLGLNDIICLYVIADNNYAEISRADN